DRLDFVELPVRSLVCREDRGGAPAKRFAPRAVDNVGAGQVESCELRARGSARKARRLRHIGNRCSQVVGPGIRGCDLKQEQPSNANGDCVSEYATAICAHLIFSWLRLLEAAIRTRNS